MEKKFTALKYFAYTLEIILVFVLQQTPFFLPEIFGAKPVMLIVVAITIACFEKEIPTTIFAVLCGVFLDLGFSGNIGFYAIVLTLLCYLISNIFRDYMMVTFLNSLAVTSVITVILILLHFLFFYVMKGYSQGGYYFVHHYLGRIFYTILTFPLFYLLNKNLCKTLRD